MVAADGLASQVRAVVLVEGLSDRRTIDRGLEEHRQVPGRFGPGGLGRDLTLHDMERLGFFVSDADLEGRADPRPGRRSARSSGNRAQRACYADPTTLTTILPLA